MILAFDTSNYTTSVCLVSKGTLVGEWRTLVKVKQGDQGIRQSDAFFQHTQVLQQWVDQVLKQYGTSLEGVCVATRPRPVEGSYMPVFNAGRLVGTAIANALGIPLYETSHQEGHLYAAIHTGQCKAGVLSAAPFLFFHMSGGTTELHAVTWRDGQAKMTLVAETADISFGQLIDRIGVAAGLSFPCGAQMDELARPGTLKHKLPSFKAGATFNLSGYENYFKGLLKQNPDHPEWVYDSVFNGLHLWLSKIVLWAVAQTGLNTVVLAGGVAASRHIAKGLLANQKLRGIDFQFCDPKYASDNAFGVALIGEERLRRI